MLRNCQNLDEWVLAIEEELHPWLGNSTNLFLPAGETPKPLYKKWRQASLAGLDRMQLHQIDEIEDGRAVFATFFKNELPTLTVRPPGAEAAKPGVAILGLGLNGHVGFHEPHLPRNFSFGLVDLESSTCDRLRIPTGTQGRTYGLGHFLRCEKVSLIVRGPEKQDLVKSVLQGDTRYPASALTSLTDFCLINLRS